MALNHEQVLARIIQTRPNEQTGLVYDYEPKGDAAEFYREMFDGHDIPGEYHAKRWSELKHTAAEGGIATRRMAELVSQLKCYLPDHAVAVEIGGGMSQERSGWAFQQFPFYFPLDISSTSIAQYVERFELPGIVADATVLPFKDSSLDCVFTHTFLEHLADPRPVIDEIIRVLKDDGVVAHNDAWFCRWWQRFGVVGIKDRDKMTPFERLICAAAWISELPIVRFPPVVMRRLFNNYSSRRGAAIRVRKLKPNYELHLGCDEDAACGIDPMDIVNYYERRGFSWLNGVAGIRRSFFRSPYVVLKKTAV